MWKLILVLFLVFSSCGKGEEAAVETRREPEAGALAEKEETLESLQSIREKVKNRSLPSKYGRKDPFALIEMFAGVRAGQAKTKNQLKFILEGIIWDAEKPMAVIDGRTVEQGDKIGDRTIERIDKDSVTLFGGKNGKKRIKLRL